MEKYLSEIESALNHGLKFIALQSALTLPDICGALTSDGTKSVKERYTNWYDQYFLPIYPIELSANDCYRLRCSNLHQGSFQDNKSSFDKIIFVDTEKLVMINSIIQIQNPDGTTTNIYTLHIDTFCRNMVECVRKWLDIVKEDTNFKKNYPNMVKVHSEGLAPIAKDIPIIY